MDKYSDNGYTYGAKVPAVLLMLFMLLLAALSMPALSGEDGDTVTVGQLNYLVVGDENAYLSVIGPSEGTEISGVLEIPSSVTVGDITYNVRTIGYAAFKGCSDITALVIPNTINYIQSDAFRGCSGICMILNHSSSFSYGSGAFMLGTSDHGAFCYVYGMSDGYITTFDDPYTTFVYRDRVDVAVSSVDVDLGTETVDIPVYVTENTGYKSISFDVTYNTDFMYYTGFKTDLTDSVSVTASGGVCSVVSDFGNAFYEGTGVLVILSFSLSEDIPVGMFPLMINDLEIEPNSGIYDRTATSGLLTVNWMAGDINGDMKIDAKDSLLLRKYIAGHDVTLTGRGDVNNDGLIDLRDSLLLRSYLVGNNVELKHSYDSADIEIKIFGSAVHTDRQGVLYIQSGSKFIVTEDLVQKNPDFVYGTTYSLKLDDSITSVDVYQCELVSGNVSNITYVLNGGTASGAMPQKYTEGQVTDLSYPTSPEGKTFAGWYTDEACTQNLLYIPADMSGDMTLYAKWADDLVGLGYSMKATGTIAIYVNDGWTSTELSGYDIIAMNGLYSSEYLVHEDTKYIIDNEFLCFDSWYWHSSKMSRTAYMGTFGVVIDGVWNTTVDCVYMYSESGEVMKVYLLYGWLPVKIDYQYQASGVGLSIDFRTDRIVDVAIPEECSITVHTGFGVQTDAPQTTAFGKSITLTATCDDGTEFKGWYDSEGNLLSTELEYTTGLIVSDVEIYALNSAVYDILIDEGESYTIDPGLTDVTWKVTEIDLDENTTYDYLGTSLVLDCAHEQYVVQYMGITAGGDIIDKVLYLFSDKTVVRTYSWTYNDVPYTIDLSIKTLDVLEYMSYEGSRSQGSAAHNREFITYDDPYVIQLKDYFTDKTSEMNNYGKISLILSFVQMAIEYEYDSVSTGQEEYWKFPLETLYDTVGDCEDTSILFCAIAKAMGFDVGLLLFSDHAVGAVNMTELGYTKSSVRWGFCATGVYYYLKDNNQYLYRESSSAERYYLFCETTGEAEIGYVWSEDYTSKKSYSITRAAITPDYAPVVEEDDPLEPTPYPAPEITPEPEQTSVLYPQS